MKKAGILAGLALLCAGLLAACQAGPAGAGSGGDPGGGGDAAGGAGVPNDNGLLNGGADEAAANDNANDNGTVNDNADGLGRGTNDNGSPDESDNRNDNEAANDNSDDVDDGANDNAAANENNNSPSHGGGGGGGTSGPNTLSITPGVGAAGIVVGESTREDVEQLHGAPEEFEGGVRYTSLGIFIWFDDQDVVQTLLVGDPYAGQTPGGNGIGSSIGDFRSEFGHVDVPDQADNFRVWETDGIAVDFDAGGLAVGIQIILPT